MNDQEPYSKREQDNFREELSNRMTKQDEMLSKIYEQTSKTNGRVSKLEEKTSDYHDMKTLVGKHENWRWYTLGIGATMILLGGFIYSLSIQNIHNYINQKIQDSQDTIIKAINEQLKGSSPNFTNSVSVH